MNRDKWPSDPSIEQGTAEISWLQQGLLLCHQTPLSSATGTTEQQPQGDQPPPPFLSKPGKLLFHSLWFFKHLATWLRHRFILRKKHIASKQIQSFVSSSHCPDRKCFCGICAEFTLVSECGKSKQAIVYIPSFTVCTLEHQSLF